MKKIIVFLAVSIFLGMFNVVFARELIIDGFITQYNGTPVSLVLNGDKFVPTEGLMDPIVLDNRVLVPVREVFEKFGGKVSWSDETQSVTLDFTNTLSKENRKIVLTIGSRTATVDGESIRLDVPAKIINGKTMVPARFIAEQAGFDVQWDARERIVYINAEKIQVDKVVPIEDAIDASERERLESMFFPAEYCSPLGGDKITFYIYGKNPEDGVIAYRVMYNDKELMYEYAGYGDSLSVKKILDTASKKGIELVEKSIKVEVSYAHTMSEEYKSPDALIEYTYDIID